MNKIGFDNDKYLKLQSEKIKERIAMLGGKLYLEFGGKLFDDYHASRVLPGFLPDSKLKMLLELKDQAEIVIAINANDIEKNKVRGDLGITYDLDVLRLIDIFKGLGLYVGSVVLTMFASQPAAINFAERLKKVGIPVYHHYAIEGYPSNINKIVSDEGYGKNEYIQTSRSLVVVTAPGPGSGKMATCLSQLYHENKRGIKSGYAKFETFPVWNLPLKHPVNLAYESATADLNDINMIDSFHLEAYGEMTVNYNRDIEIFPVLNAMLTKIMGVSPYKSPTDMGVNMAGYCICDDEVCRQASRQEMIRRYLDAAVEVKKGELPLSVLSKHDILLHDADITLSERPVIQKSLDKATVTGEPAVAIELNDGRIITGKTSILLGASAAAVLNALKVLAGLDDDEKIIAPEIIKPIEDLKINNLGSHNPRLHIEEVLIALSVSSVTNPHAKMALDKLGELKNAQAHSTVILSSVDRVTFKKLGMNVTSEAVYQVKKLYHGGH